MNGACFFATKIIEKADRKRAKAVLSHMILGRQRHVRPIIFVVVTTITAFYLTTSNHPNQNCDPAHTLMAIQFVSTDVIGPDKHNQIGVTW